MPRSPPVRAQLDEEKEGDRDGSIPITVPDRQEPVSFNRNLLPIFQAKCLACHSKSLALGNVVLEDRQLILSGDRAEPLVVPGNGADSLLLQVAAHRRQPFMPPEGNAAEAAPLTSEELGLLKLWIDQGARAGNPTSLLPDLELEGHSRDLESGLQRRHQSRRQLRRLRTLQQDSRLPPGLGPTGGTARRPRH